MARRIPLYEFIDVFVQPNEQLFLTLFTIKSVEFFLRGVIINDALFPSGTTFVLHAFHPDSDEKVGYAQCTKTNHTIKVDNVQGIFAGLSPTGYNETSSFETLLTLETFE